MISMGQLTHLPPYLANNPFHPLLVKFSRTKMGSFEELFTAEAFLLRYSWAGLLVLFALVLPNLEEIDYVATVVRLLTMVYPCLFLWSLTRLAGVELMQLVLDGHWTGEILATPVGRRDLTDGFITPLWLIVRQYLLISIFSLALYGLERHVLVVDGEIYLSGYLRHTFFYVELFMSAVAWIVFVYLARMLAEVRLRNGLLKGLASVALFAAGGGLIIAYCLFFVRGHRSMTDTSVLVALAFLVAGLLAISLWFHLTLVRHFRRYLSGQLDIDMLIYDEVDPHTTGWTKPDEH